MKALSYNSNRQSGYHANPAPTDQSELIEFLNLKLASRGYPIYGRKEDYPILMLADSMIANAAEKNRLLSDYLCPTDQRIQNYLNSILAEFEMSHEIRLPSNALTLELPGLARILSLPPDADEFKSNIVESYRVKQGVLNNPKSDRRTTQGVFHIAEGGLPIPADKKAVPKITYAKLLAHALNPPLENLELPFTSRQQHPARLFVSLLLRPTVIPEVPGFTTKRSMEIRFFAPGSLVSNLDFVESIFGNAGDPYLTDNDAQLDVTGWTGQTGCVILAPHLIRLTKKELGLPNISEATERQIKEGMCWEKEDELYNDGDAFKITSRDKQGVIVTLIADNYYGYCKKEVKTQISYASNLCGLSEEEHAGGAIAFPSYDLGEDFRLNRIVSGVDHTFDEVVSRYEDLMELKPEGYGVDRNFPDIIYVSEDVNIDLRKQEIKWTYKGRESQLKLLAGKTYVLPSGYKVELIKPGTGRRWRLIGTTAEGTFCHKPCTVSGGGKSEISKSIGNAIIQGPVYIQNYEKDMERVEAIIGKHYGARFRDDSKNRSDARSLLSEKRSLGSVVKLLTPSTDYTDEYNEWLKSIPMHIKELVLVLKRVYNPSWGDNWKQYYTVDSINGHEGSELKYKGVSLYTHYLRVGFGSDGSWRNFSLRKDFHPAVKIQLEDDITASVVVPRDRLEHLPASSAQSSVKFLTNCEYMFFQRPDEAIHRGFDAAAELDFSRPNGFYSNYHPLTKEDARNMIEDVIRFDQYTDPIKRTITEFLDQGRPKYFVCTSEPRRVDGAITKNPRYLQKRPDLDHPRDRYLAELGLRLFRRIPLDKSVPMPVQSVLPGRRNNAPDKNAGVRSLSVHNPIHYTELPELFMEFISSLTGRSPSTTGAGSEGAMTKGPFNALPPIFDLNYALVSYIITGYPCFTTAAAYVGPKCRVDHDISLLVPEIWARMRGEERSADWLIKNGYFEDCKSIDMPEVKPYLHRLGYRINRRFVNTFFGRVFTAPDLVLPDEMLQPELQDRDAFIDGMKNIVETQKRVADYYFEDGSVELACPPLKALLNIMSKGEFEGKDIHHAEIRHLFTRDHLMGSDWYKARLESRQKFEQRHWQNQLDYLHAFQKRETYKEEGSRLNIQGRIKLAQTHLDRARQPDFFESLKGTIGTEPHLV